MEFVNTPNPVELKQVSTTEIVFRNLFHDEYWRITSKLNNFVA